MDAGVLTHLAVGLLTAAATFGGVRYATRDHGRRLGVLEADTKDHGQRISTIEGEMKFAMPAKGGR